MHAVFTRFIRTSGNDAAPVAGQRTDNDGLAPVFGIIKLFHRGEKSVQIHMKKTGGIHRFDPAIVYASFSVCMPFGVCTYAVTVHKTVFTPSTEKLSIKSCGG